MILIINHGKTIGKPQENQGKPWTLWTDHDLATLSFEHV
jgi:hypothetical protein